MACRFHLCQSGPGSEGARAFIKSMYATIKLDNPGFPFLIREAQGVPAKLTARYGACWVGACQAWVHLSVWKLQ